MFFCGLMIELELISVIIGVCVVVIVLSVVSVVGVMFGLIMMLM